MVGHTVVNLLLVLYFNCLVNSSWALAGHCPVVTSQSDNSSPHGAHTVYCRPYHSGLGCMSPMSLSILWFLPLILSYHYKRH